MGKVITKEYIKEISVQAENLFNKYNTYVESYSTYKYLRKLQDTSNKILEVEQELVPELDQNRIYFNPKLIAEKSLEYLNETNLSIKETSPFNKLSLETINTLTTPITNYNNVNQGNVNELLLGKYLVEDEAANFNMYKIVLEILGNIEKLYGNTYFMCSSDNIPAVLLEIVDEKVNKYSPIDNHYFKQGLKKNLLMRVKILLQNRVEKSMKLCFIDTETTGLHDILDENSAKPTQVSYIITDLEGNIVKTNNVFIIQNDIPEEVVKLNGITEEFLKSHKAITEDSFVNKYLLKDLMEENLLFIGHNVLFDLKVLHKVLKRYIERNNINTENINTDYFENTDYIDTMSVANKVKQGNNFISSSLESLSNYLKIDNQMIAKLSKELFPTVTENIRHLSHYDVTNQFIFTLKIASLVNLRKLKDEYNLETSEKAKTEVFSWG